MRILKISTYLIALFFTSNTVSQNKPVPVINTAFQPGEYLKYNVKYGLINGGYAEMQIGLEEIGFDWYFRVKAIAKTDGLVGSFAKVSDRYESVIEIPTGLPIQSIRDINESNYIRYNEVLFDREKGIAISLKSGERIIPDNTLDLLSAFYYARRAIFNEQLKKDQIINLTSYFDDNLFVIKVKYKETERVKTKFGKINCLRFVPVIETKSPFKDEKDMQVWFSDDGNFVPVKIRMKVGISTVKCDLSEYKELKNPFGKPFER